MNKILLINIKYAICTIFIVSSQVISAQCILQNLPFDAPSATEIINMEEARTFGQSFVAECTGNIVNFEFIGGTIRGLISSGTLEIYNGTDISTTPIYTQNYDQVVLYDYGVPIVFSIAEDVSLNEGNTYTILVSFSQINFEISDTNTYSSGSAVIDGILQPNLDLFFGVTLSSDCNIGNEYIMVSAYTYFSKNVLFSMPVTLSENGTVTGLGINSLTISSNIRLALYDDLNNAPNNKLTESEIATLTYGKQILPVTPINLLPGNYWIAFVASTSNVPIMLVTYYEYINYYTYIRHLTTFESDLPHPFAGFPMENTVDYPIFAEISCGLLELDNKELVIIKMYPNPAKDKLYLEGIDKNTLYSIYSTVGQKVLSGTFVPNSFIDISSLEKNLYMIKFENGFSSKFIRN